MEIVEGLEVELTRTGCEVNANLVEMVGDRNMSLG